MCISRGFDFLLSLIGAMSSLSIGSLDIPPCGEVLRPQHILAFTIQTGNRAIYSVICTKSCAIFSVLILFNFLGHLDGDHDYPVSVSLPNAELSCPSTSLHRHW